MRTKRFVIGTLLVVMALTIGLGTAWAIKTDEGEKLTGPHYNLNIIGVQKTKSAPMDEQKGHVIFVPLGSKGTKASTKIFLFPGEFEVLDKNGTDGRAEFQLPNPDPGNTGTTVYSVYIRVLGKPKGQIKMATAATDALGMEVVSDLQVIEVRETGKGKQKFSNVSQELLYIYAWVWDPVKGIYEYMRLPLFSEPLEDYLWKVDNNGCKLVQLRFYEGYYTDVDDPEDVPHLISISPTSGEQDTSLDVTITGANVDLSGVGLDDVDFGDDIDETNISASVASITVTINIAGDADVGYRYVSVELSDGTTLTIPFEVTAAP